MRRFLLRRMAFTLLAMLGATALVFFLSRLIGDPRILYMAQGRFSQAQWDALAKEMNLDKPMVVQYGIWLTQVVRGDLGRSVANNRKVSDMIRERAGNTLQLGLAGFIFAALFGVPLGVLSAVKRGGMWDYIARTFALLGQAAPPFWLGIMLLLLFAAKLQWLPSATKGDGISIKHFILPTITIGWLFAAANLRLIRTSMLEVIDSEYVKLARAKGLSRARVVWKHALRNAMIAPLTFMGINLAALVTGSVLNETVFAWPGLGRLSINAVNNNDFPVLLGTALVFSFIFLAVNFWVDVLYAYLDPRIRLS